MFNLDRTMAELRRRAPYDKQAAQAVEMIDGKSVEQQKQVAMNMLKERGFTVEQFVKNFFR